jgi:hypothetical protein
MMRAVAPIIGGFYLPRHAPHHGQALGINFDSSHLFKHPLRALVDNGINFQSTQMILEPSINYLACIIHETPRKMPELFIHQAF